jgi:mono/diheme cytochrome c family protein
MNGSGGMMNGGRAGRPARPPVGTFPTATGQGHGTGAGDGGRLFLASCGGCHTLAAAGTTGSAGPDLDQARPSYARVVEEVTDGGDGMPSFADSLTGAQIRAIAGYVAGSVR